MVAINYGNREVSCKIVYYGPGLSGKTTNLQYIHGKVPGTTRGDLISLATDADRTLYFDFLPINIGTINGFTTRFQLYTVPGQVFYNATRKLVLRGVDGLIFVADSQRDKADENVESLNNLKENLADYGYNLDSIPMILQYNKRDLPDIMDIEELDKLLNEHNWPVFESVAHKGKGVFDTLKLIIKMILEKARKSDTAKKIQAGGEREAVSEPARKPPEKVAAAMPQKAPEQKPVSGVSSMRTVPESEVQTGSQAPRIAARQKTGQAATAVAEAVSDEEKPSTEKEGHQVVTVSPDSEDDLTSVVDNMAADKLEENVIPESSMAESAGVPKHDEQETIINESPSTEMEKETAEQAPEEESDGEELNDDPFALPSARPKMATSIRVKQKKKKGFFLFRWLFGRK